MEKGILGMGENNGALMEGLAVHSTQSKKPEDEIVEVSPSLILRPASELCLPLQQCVQEFWNLSPKVRVFSVSKNPHYYWHMQDFYVAQKGLDNEGRRWAQLRISEGLCQFLFETTLGKPLDEPDFTLSHIRNFEVFLLERFSRKLFHLLSPHLLKRPGKKAPPPEKDQLLHMVWALEGEPEQVNQIILTAPQACIQTKFENLSPVKSWRLGDENFLHAQADAVFRLGATAARLEEVQQLEEGDIIVFENSNVNQWNLLDPVTKQWLPVNVKVSDKLKVPDLLAKQGTMAMANEMQIKQNIWDNLQVEVTATFNPIRMPLKHLKEMEQGLVVEVGDLMDNRVTIEVEGHAVAWGELLVLGDRFGVRIQGIHENAQNIDENSAAVSTISKGQDAPPSEAEDTDSNLDDTDDDEYMDLDLDESDFDDLDDEEDWS